MSEPLSKWDIELVQHVIVAIGDQVKIDVNAMVQICGVCRLIGKIKVKLMPAEP